MRISIVIAAAFSAGLLCSTTASATDADDALKVVKQYDDAFNKNDGKTANALCTADATIIDDFAPHIWTGANTCSVWWDALDVYDKKEGITDEVVKFGKPWRNVVTGDRAYIVVPATYTYKQNGKPVKEIGSNWALVLQKTAAGWKLAGWSWAQH
jgi:hypothetical protein